jgi:transposase
MPSMKTRTDTRMIKTVGIDLGKRSFQRHAVDDAGRKLLAKQLTRKQLKVMMAQLPAGLAGM